MNIEKKWIWQNKNFPNFTYDYTQIEPLIFKLIEKSGELKGKMSYLATTEKDNFSLLFLRSMILYYIL